MDQITQENVLIKFVKINRILSHRLIQEKLNPIFWSIIVSFQQVKYMQFTICKDVAPVLVWKDVLDESEVYIYERKGPNIQSLFKYFGGKFSPITITMLFHLMVYPTKFLKRRS
jgi:hypothetical protein